MQVCSCFQFWQLHQRSGTQGCSVTPDHDSPQETSRESPRVGLVARGTLMTPITEERKTAYFERAVHQQQHETGDGVSDSAQLTPISEEGVEDEDQIPATESRPGAHTDSEKCDARRSSMHQMMFAGVRRLSKAAPSASWNLLRLSTMSAIGYLTPKMSTLSPEALQAMPWRQRADFYLSQPEDSSLGRMIQIAVMVIIVLNMTIMAGETLDGPRYGSTDPGYVYLPGDKAFWFAEAGFTTIYVVEFIMRSIVTKSKTQYWKSWITWIDVVALVPFLIHVGIDTVYKNDSSYDPTSVEDKTTILRLVRLVRLVLLSRIFLGTKILIRVSKHVLAPLKITLFFLITVVMVFATAIFYAEPCYDLSTCTFTDIFNAGYFVMLTVATVGYGSQVPSFSYPGSIFVACVVMLFGTLYLSMPLAIVGIKYDLAWREYDEHQKQKPKATAKLPPNALASEDTLASGHDSRARTDDTLKAIDTTRVSGLALQISEHYFDIGNKLIEVGTVFRNLVGEPLLTTTEGASQRSRQRSEHTNQALDTITTIMKLHKKVCTEIRESLLGGEATKTRVSSKKLSERLMSLTKRGGSDSNRLSTRSGMSKAKSAISAITARVTIKQRVRHSKTEGFRSMVWDIFEHNDRSLRATVVNRFRLVVVILSIVLFYSQTTPELQLTGLRTVLCRRTIKDYCSSYHASGCYVYDSNGTVTSTPIDFTCSIDSDDSQCYGGGYNYGSDNFSSTCMDAFGFRGAKRVCNNRLCKTSESFMFDMEPYWVYFEFVFGILFTIEMLLRSASHPMPSMLLSDLTFFTDLAVLFPFFVETSSIISGVMPIYSVVPTAPSFLSGVRVLKTLRILKVGTHIPGARVLLKTGELIYRRLMIPLFLLFVGCVVSAAIFYELERGTECFVGKRCMWWDINVLTPSISAGLPTGKRILVQNTDPTLFVDMLRSTWFSLVTYTTVGYGDLYPRTALGKLFDIVCMIGSACYTAMPLTLVGGQFYVCYEVFVQEEKRRRHGADHQIAPKNANLQNQIIIADTTNRAVSFTSNAQRLAQASAFPQTAEPAQLPDLSISSSSVVVNPLMLTASDNKAESDLKSGSTSMAETADIPGVSVFELQILNQFFLVHKVLNEIIEDMSSLNRLGSERVGLLKKSAAAMVGADSVVSSLESILLKERAIEAKISENMVFCETVYLAFAPLIERNQGFQVARTSRDSISLVLPRESAQSLEREALSSASDMTSVSPLDVQLHANPSMISTEQPILTDRTGRVSAVILSNTPLAAESVKIDTMTTTSNPSAQSTDTSPNGESWEM